jgi:NAD(P)-dependent dehydrogenase (short-subunit alcohol dehydrogenase family)
MQNFVGKTIVITGASGSIGQALTIRFINQGARVYALARNKKALAKLAQRVNSERLTTIAGDATNRHDINKLMAAAEKIDVLVPLVGLFIPAPFEQLDDDTIQSMLDLNIKSTILTIQAALPLLNEGSAITTISSSAHLKPIGTGGGALYAASKAAVRSLSRSLALELMPQKIRVNCICPGPIDTERMAAPFTVPDDIRADIASEVPMKRLGKAEEVADAISYLSSEQASYITGIELAVDGGLTKL